MASQLLTVRLTPEDERAAQALQDAGVNVSDLARRAIREEAARLQPSRIDPEAVKAEMLRLYPDDPDHPRVPRPDAGDRRDVQAFLREKSKARHRKIQGQNR